MCHVHTFICLLDMYVGYVWLQAVGRSENPRGGPHINVMGILFPPDEIGLGLTDLTKSGGHDPSGCPPPPGCDSPAAFFTPENSSNSTETKTDKPNYFSS
jgi:hypothetical protein